MASKANKNTLAAKQLHGCGSIMTVADTARILNDLQNKKPYRMLFSIYISTAAKIFSISCICMHTYIYVRIYAYSVYVYIYTY